MLTLTVCVWHWHPALLSFCLPGKMGGERGGGVGSERERESKKIRGGGERDGREKDRREKSKGGERERERERESCL